VILVTLSYDSLLIYLEKHYDLDRNELEKIKSNYL